MKRICIIAAISLAATLAPLSFAQSSSTNQPQAPAPPAVLEILREDIKPGKGSAHDAFETGYVQALTKANWPIYYLAMTTISGPSEAWFILTHDSFAGLEKGRQNLAKTPTLQRQLDQLDHQDGEFRANQRTMLAVFNKELSYHSERVAASVPKSRYFNVLTVRMRPGRDIEFNQAVRTYIAAAEKAKIEGGFATYQVISGAPGGTYLIFIPMKSLAEMDAEPANQRAINAALGMEEGQKLLKAVGESFLTEESAVFAFNPKTSYVSKEFASNDPDFWTPKAATATKPAAAPKKQVAKVGGNQ